MKKLGFGFMRLPLTDPEDRTSVDIELTKKMVDEYMSAGFEYFDTAWVYCGFNSENILRQALVERYPRESFKIATKLHAGFINNTEERDAMFSEQLKKVGVDYFDYYLLHTIYTDFYKKYSDLDCFNWIIEKKRSGQVKNIGFSFHDTPELLDEILTAHPEMDFVQLQINYLDWDSERIQSENCYKVARRHGKNIIVMEPVKGGALANVPADVEKMYKEISPDMSIPSWAIRFAAGLEGVIMVLSGMSTIDQVLDNTSYMKDFKPLSAEETDAVFKAARMIRNSIAVPCTGCEYCVDGCPKDIPIPSFFSLYNRDKKVDSRPSRDEYNELAEKLSPASACIECGQCEAICPQKLSIIDDLKKVAKHFEKK